MDATSKDELEQADTESNSPRPDVANPSYFHPKNILEGKRGRILYAKAGIGWDGVWKPEGWVLPGGERTTNHDRAVAVAREINRITTEAEQLKAARPPSIVAGDATWP